MREDEYTRKIEGYCNGEYRKLYLSQIMGWVLDGDPFFRTRRGLMRWKCILDLKYLFLNVLHIGGDWSDAHEALLPILEIFRLNACYLGAVKTGRIKKYTYDFKNRLENYLNGYDMNQMFLCYRGFFKTTLISIDLNISMILVNPNIRIMIMSGAKGNAESINTSMKSYFESNKLFRWLFPEYCPVPSSTGKINFGTLERFTVPNRTLTGYREPTVLAVSPGTKLAGYHFDYHDDDDIIDEKNVNTDDTLKKAKQTYELSLSLFDNPTKPFSCVIGTHYHALDLYADLKKKIADGLGNYKYKTFNPDTKKIIKRKKKVI